DLYKCLNIITELLIEIKNAVKDDSVINKKISEATESFTKFSINITDLQSFVNTLQAHTLKQDEELAAWAKSSTNMAWNLGSRLSGLERAQNHIQSKISSLKEDTYFIKTMITKMYEVFKGQSASSVTLTLALTHIPEHIEGENATNTATKEPPSHTERETDDPKLAIPISSIQPTKVPLTQAQLIIIITTNLESSQAAPRIDEGKRIANESEKDPLKKPVPASTIVHLDPDEEIKKSVEEERLLTISKPEVIKVVQEEAEKIGLDAKKIASAKAGEKFKKAQDAEHQVLKREHTKKVRKSLKLGKHKFENYMWTINSRLKPETITDIKIHPKNNPVVLTVYKGTNGRNFDVHKPFAFGLPALAPAPEQASSKSSRKKRKHMELGPEIKIPGLECNRALPENVSFVNNMVIEEPEYGIFFTDEFGDQAFQRWSDIDKVRMELSCHIL
ncbi:hypothetical protein Tco_0701350, partial [Tanacetum coccineum]